MSESSNTSVVPAALHLENLPDSLSGGSTVLVASAVDPSEVAISLRILCARGTAADTAFVVTTDSAEQTIETYGQLGTETTRPSLRIVDTASVQQSVSALYGEPPVVFTPSPGDLERLVLALSDLSEHSTPSSGARHLVVRSLTPILKSAPTARVCTVLERITGLRSETGLCLLGLDYTAHDEETMAAVGNCVDGVLWVTRSSNDRLVFDYRPSTGRYSQSVIGGSTDA